MMGRCSLFPAVYRGLLQFPPPALGTGLSQPSACRDDLPPQKWAGLGRQSLGPKFGLAAAIDGREKVLGREAMDVLRAVRSREQIASGVAAGSVDPVMDAL